MYDQKDSGQALTLANRTLVLRRYINPQGHDIYVCTKDEENIALIVRDCESYAPVARVEMLKYDPKLGTNSLSVWGMEDEKMIALVRKRFDEENDYDRDSDIQREQARIAGLYGFGSKILGEYRKSLTILDAVKIAQGVENWNVLEDKRDNGFDTWEEDLPDGLFNRSVKYRGPIPGENIGIEVTCQTHRQYFDRGNPPAIDRDKLTVKVDTFLPGWGVVTLLDHQPLPVDHCRRLFSRKRSTLAMRVLNIAENASN
jgi:hypothetical protein